MFNKIITWRRYTETINAKAFKIFIRIYHLSKIERLRANIKLSLHKTVIRSRTTYAFPVWEFAEDIYLLKEQGLAKQRSPHH